jgi:biotin synthase
MVVRSDWTQSQVQTLFDLPFYALFDQARSLHKTFFPNQDVQLATLLSIKTGGCPEDCGYCPQSAHHKQVALKSDPLMDVATVQQAAQAAKAKGASRFCMGAAWRSPNTHTEKGQAQFNAVLDMIREVKALGMEACVTLGMLTPEQALALKEAGLDAYNHNIDTSPDYYDKIITTRTFDDRLETLSHVRDAGLSVCCGGIIGMGEQMSDRAAMIAILGGMTPHPESVPINALVPVDGTPLGHQKTVDPMDIVRTIAVARVVMPTSRIRLSAGRESMSQETQILCLLVGANSFFYGDTLLTAPNQAEEKDRALLAMMGLPVKGTASEVVDEVCHA